MFSIGPRIHDTILHRCVCVHLYSLADLILNFFFPNDPSIVIFASKNHTAAVDEQVAPFKYHIGDL